MTDETTMPDDVKAETAAYSPELAEHDRLAALEAKIADLKSKILYAAADAQNVRRRLEKDAADAKAYAATAFARDMLSVADNLSRAIAGLPEASRADEALKPFVTGIEATAREIDGVFQRHGITRILSVGQQLDPNRHQAMVEIPSDQPAGTIVQEMQAGYMLKDRLLRPAMVGVAKAAG